MKIAYMLSPGCVVSGNSNGIKSQALEWRRQLVNLGHHVDLIDVWNSYNWREYDIIHFFGSGLWLYSLVESLHHYNSNLVVSPIVDSLQSKVAYRLASYMAIPKLRMVSVNSTYRHLAAYFKMFYVRSDYEKGYFTQSYGIDRDKVQLMPLSTKYHFTDCDLSAKEPFCLHISSFTQSRKNVYRLCQAAIKYNFRLVIAGSKGSANDFKRFEQLIAGHPNIEILGFVSEEQMMELYRKAKVFALPSIAEGVGLVALEAASFGCDIVITNIGGPKEYYNEMAYVVNPYSVDDIGQKVVSALNTTRQPQLFHHVMNQYSEDILAKKLEASYLHVIEK